MNLDIALVIRRKHLAFQIQFAGFQGFKLITHQSRITIAFRDVSQTTFDGNVDSVHVFLYLALAVAPLFTQASYFSFELSHEHID